MADIAITRLEESSTTRAALRAILVEVVAGGGSVSFMYPLDPAAAATFLRESSGAPARLTAPPSGLFLDRVYYPGDPRTPEIRAITPLTRSA